MIPYNEAWAVGTHAEEAECIECHVDAGLANRLMHKGVALQEVIAHLRGDTSFPRAKAPDVPDGRCISCHDDLADAQEGGFSHAEHAERATCAGCHEDTGHAVTREALDAAGVLDAESWGLRFESALASDVVAAPGAGVANLADHVDTRCSDCHDMARTGCAACHEVPDTKAHDLDPDCLVCHSASAEWQFAHPESVECLDCHVAPDTEAHTLDLTCVRCHSIETWGFEHPASGDCSPCHSRPDTEDDHPARDDCGTCHSTTGDWDHDR